MKKDNVRYIYGKKHPYLSLFHEKGGVYVRTGLREDGTGTDQDPFVADFPELLDIGIMGQGIQNHMLLTDFQKIIRECEGKTYQVLLGGREDPEQHPDFAAMAEYSRCHGIVPNITTSGLKMTAELAAVCEKYCGEAAVRWSDDCGMKKAADLLLKAGVRTKLHYVLSAATIGDAVRRLETNGFPAGIHTVVFVLYKPAGPESKEKVLTTDMPLLKAFYRLVDEGGFPYQIGFDACMVPGLLCHTHNLEPASLDACESGRWSAYISPDLYMMPCRFDSQKIHGAVSLRDHTMEEAWNSGTFERFRRILKNACPDCKKRENCMGGCPVCPEIALCGQKA